VISLSEDNIISGTRRIAISVGPGYVPGVNAVLNGVVLAAEELGWQVVGIRSGYDGLLFPDRYLSGGLLDLTSAMLRDQNGSPTCLLGTAEERDPLHPATWNESHFVRELDRSGEVLELLHAAHINGVISVVGAGDTATAEMLARMGMNTVCIPKSIENDVAETTSSFGFDTALGLVAHTLERTSEAAQAAKIIAVVEVPGRYAGWLALQAAMGICADVVVIPEIPYDIHSIADAFEKKVAAGRPYGVVVAAEGAGPIDVQLHFTDTMESKSRSDARGDLLSLNERPGRAAEAIANGLEELTGSRCFDLVAGDLANVDALSVVDRQLGMTYGASAVKALHNNESGVMVALNPPDTKYVPLAEVANEVRSVPIDSELVQLARALGISFGCEDLSRGAFVPKLPLPQFRDLRY